MLQSNSSQTWPAGALSSQVVVKDLTPWHSLGPLPALLSVVASGQPTPLHDIRLPPQKTLQKHQQLDTVVQAYQCSYLCVVV